MAPHSSDAARGQTVFSTSLSFFFSPFDFDFFGQFDAESGNKGREGGGKDCSSQRRPKITNGLFEQRHRPPDSSDSSETAMK